MKMGVEGHKENTESQKRNAHKPLESEQTTLEQPARVLAPTSLPAVC